jgi:uncharacterized protein (DUF1499 family)
MSRSIFGRIAAWFGEVSLPLAAVAPALAHFELLAPFHGFVAFGVAWLNALLCILFGVLGLLIGPAGGRRSTFKGMIPGLVVVVAVLVAARGGASLPRINDITTDTENPPSFASAQSLPENAGRDMAYPGEEFARQQKAGYPNLAPLSLAMPPDQAFSRVQLAARAMETWKITREDAAARVLEGYDTTPLFRFKDDFVIEVRPADSGSVVQMRSKSRDGKGDVGANAKRIESFFARLR